MLGGRTTRPASDTEEVPGLRELAVEGLIGAVALYFLVRTAPDGMGGFWWVCVVLFAVGLVSFLRGARGRDDERLYRRRTLRRAAARRGIAPNRTGNEVRGPWQTSRSTTFVVGPPG
jgi:hypothetical protein